MELVVNVAVVGAAGYTGVEAVRWMLGHPRFHVSLVTSASEAGRGIAELYPALAGLTQAVFAEPEPDVIAANAEVALLAVPHTAALDLVPALLDRGVTVIDLSADFRLRDSAVYEAWYEVPHTAPDLLAEAVYGLPELERERLPGARLVACPGCYPTAAVLAALPALAAGLWDGGLVCVDSKSGVSGAGKTPTPAAHYVSVNESLAPYKVGSHRHTPEIEQAFSDLAGASVTTVFVPHLVPMSRGLISTVYLGVKPGTSASDVLSVYRERYAGEPFVRVCEPGSMPATSVVRGTNRAVVGVHLDERTGTLVAACAIDNLGKGAAGQAIQCANAVFGFPETEGLDIACPVV